MQIHSYMWDKEVQHVWNVLCVYVRYAHKCQIVPDIYHWLVAKQPSTTVLFCCLWSSLVWTVIFCSFFWYSSQMPTKANVSSRSLIFEIVPGHSYCPEDKINIWKRFCISLQPQQILLVLYFSLRCHLKGFEVMASYSPPSHTTVISYILSTWLERTFWGWTIFFDLSVSVPLQSIYLSWKNLNSTLANE